MSERRWIVARRDGQWQSRDRAWRIGDQASGPFETEAEAQARCVRLCRIDATGYEVVEVTLPDSRAGEQFMREVRR